MANGNPKNTINAPQALFGTLFGLWFGSIVHSVFGTMDLAPGSLFNLVTSQIIFVFGSLIIIAAFIICFVKFQQYVLTIPIISKDKKKIKKRRFHLLKMVGSFLLCLGLITLFVQTTQSTFPGIICTQMKLFGISQPIIWMLMDMFIVKSDFFQSNTNPNT